MNKTTAQASEELCTLALNLGSADNVTVIVVQFVHS
jgi:serine/threonine protein phosphatase PrpC